MSDPKSDPSSIGNLLAPFGVTTSDISKALTHMLASDRKLGEALIELGIINQHQLEFALARQEVMRSTESSGRKGRRSNVDAACRIIDYATFRTKQAGEAMAELGEHVEQAAGTK